MKGRIHSFQSLGTLDGPGVRFVAFAQGCPLRCGCCHNPDTWQVHGGEEMSAEEKAEKKAALEEKRKKKQEAREARWAELDKRDADKAAAKAAKKLAKERKRKRKALEDAAKRAEREMELLNKYKQKFREKKARSN